jgi:hypothetical protein
METDLFLKKIPAGVKELIAREAAIHRRSINQEAIVLLEEALAQRARCSSRRHEIQQVLAAYRALPIKDDRPVDELVPYDDDGLPR